MGMEQVVRFAPGSVPSFEAVRDFLAGRGFAVQVRMIDGQLAFPDEVPPEGWGELRLGTPGGMITVRRSGDALAFVTWGNADPAMLEAWNTLAQASATVGGGRVIPSGPEA